VEHWKENLSGTGRERRRSFENWPGKIISFSIPQDITTGMRKLLEENSDALQSGCCNKRNISEGEPASSCVGCFVPKSSPLEVLRRQECIGELDLHEIQHCHRLLNPFQLFPCFFPIVTR
jgi:hypothetical protein